MLHFVISIFAIKIIAKELENCIIELDNALQDSQENVKILEGENSALKLQLDQREVAHVHEIEELNKLINSLQQQLIEKNELNQILTEENEKHQALIEEYEEVICKQQDQLIEYEQNLLHEDKEINTSPINILNAEQSILPPVPLIPHKQKDVNLLLNKKLIFQHKKEIHHNNSFEMKVQVDDDRGEIMHHQKNMSLLSTNQINDSLSTSTSSLSFVSTSINHNQIPPDNMNINRCENINVNKSLTKKCNHMTKELINHSIDVNRSITIPERKFKVLKRSSTLKRNSKIQPIVELTNVVNVSNS